MNRIPNLSSTIVFRLIFSVVVFLSPLILVAQSKNLSAKTDAFLKSLTGHFAERCFFGHAPTIFEREGICKNQKNNGFRIHPENSRA
jgi:hypothetical protein